MMFFVSFIGFLFAPKIIFAAAQKNRRPGQTTGEAGGRFAAGTWDCKGEEAASALGEMMV